MAAIIGGAQAPGLQWRPNPEGPRTIDEAVEIARRHGIKIPGYVEFVTDNQGTLGKGVYAQYFKRLFFAQQEMHWSEFFNKNGVIPILVRKSVLESDEAIVAIFAHEMHEVSRLREIFAESEDNRLSFLLLDELVRPGVKRNLHDEAWDIADEAVLKMRGIKS